MAKARYSLKIDDRMSNEVAGVAFDSVETRVETVESTRRGSRTVVGVVETTTYGFADSEEEYSYAARHLVTLVNDGAGWAVTDIVTPDPVGNLHPDRVTKAMIESPADRRAAAAARVRAARGALERNAPALATASDAKANGSRVRTPGQRHAGEVAHTGPGLNSIVEPSALARPAGEEIATADDEAVMAASPGSGPPYDYNAMVKYALTYAVAPPAVSYTRDQKDCTTFISWALYMGGWKEAGAQDYPSVTWNRDDDNVWYWRCNSCSPRHSYTWGGAANWLRFAYYYRNVPTLRYVTDIVPSDVLQMEVDGYGSTTWPDHTMMATGYANGWDLLSYHSTDTRNKPLNIILSQHNGPYWALRT